MSSGSRRLTILQYLRLKWHLALRAILHIWVRSRVFPEPLSNAGIDPDTPLCYIMDTYALSSLLILDQVCEQKQLVRPLYPIKGAEHLGGRAWAALRRLKGIFVRRHTSRRSSEMLKNMAQYALEHPEFEMQLVPVSILVGRAPDKENSLVKVLFSEGWDVGGRLGRLFSTWVNGRGTCVYMGTPLSLRELVDEKSDAAIAVRKLYRLARTQLRQTRETAIGPDLSHRRTLFKQVIASDQVQATMAARLESEDTTQEKLRTEAERAVREIAANYSYTAVRFSDVLLTWFWSRIFNGVELNHFKRFDENASGKEIIYVPCHRSHIDYLLLSYLLYINGHVPPHIAAGSNLNLPVLGQFIRRCGAFFLRRSFRKDPLYAAVFNEYLSIILGQGVAIEYFIEGGRSRTGRLLPPKGGMLQMTVRAYMRQPKKPIIFQPVYIGYEQLVEGNSYISELGGKEKKSESLSDLFSVFGILRRNYGKVHVNFGEPIYLDSLLQSHDKKWSELYTEDKPDWLPELVDGLATSIMTNINGAADVNPVNLLATSLLATAKHALPREELEYQLDLCLKLLKSTPSSASISITKLGVKEIIEYGQELGIIEVRQHTLGDILFVPEKSAVQLTYFRNNIAHLFALPSVIASCFLVRSELSRARVFQLFKQIYPYLRKELFLPWSDEDAKNILAEHLEVFNSLGLITGNRILKRTGGGSQAAGGLGLLGRGMLHTFERYFITLSALANKGSGALSSSELEELCILYAQRISLLHEFDAPEFYDKTLFRQFITNLASEGIVSEDDDGKLMFDKKLLAMSAGARLVMSTELRHGIIQVASGNI
ncbi:MAG: glycerol-3-phosphate 1-O-acyltransferase PlsB [Proteobacteria bacterium]|nr:glycerol-3-phosphate 1-O-acyltransferase PlsB [Pseudomonadota bacterium]